MKRTTYEKVWDVPRSHIGLALGTNPLMHPRVLHPWRTRWGYSAVDPVAFYGFEKVETGGGCTALEVVDANGWTALLTDGEAQAPESPDRGWYLGVRDPQGYLRWEIMVGATGFVELTEYDEGEDDAPVVGSAAEPDVCDCSDCRRMVDDPDEGEGWGVFSTAEGPRIEAFDDSDRFKDDNEAWLYVWQKAAEGSQAHVDALEEVQEGNPTEYERIRDYCTPSQREGGAS